jgi:hypothetical protein
VSPDGASDRDQLWLIFRDSGPKGMEEFIARFEGSIERDRQEIASKRGEIAAARKFAAETAESPSDVSGTPWTQDMYDAKEREIAVVEQRIALKQRIVPVLRTQATEIRQQPTIATEDQELLGRLQGRHPVYTTFRRYRESLKSLAMAGALKASARDKAAAEESYGFLQEQALSLQKQVLGELQAQGFGSIAEFEQATAGYEAFFQRFALQAGFAMLQENEDLVNAESKRYGEGTGGDLAALKGALGPLKAKLDEADKVAMEAEQYSSPMGDPNLALSAEAEGLHKEARALAQGLAMRFPIMADPTLDLRALVVADDARLKSLLQDTSTDRLHDIAKSRENLTDDPELIWQMEGAVARARQMLGVQKGSIFDMIIEDRLARIELNEMFKKLLIGALAIGLGLLTGGTGTVAVLAAVGTAALGVGVAYTSVRDYLVKQAAVGSAFDRAKALSANEPSLFWVAVDVAAAILDVALAAKAFRTLAPIAQEVMAARGGAKAVAEATEKGAEALRREGEAIQKGLGDRLAERALKARAEREALEAGKDLGKAEEVVSAFGGKIKVTENGWVFVCYSPCEMLREAFEVLRHDLVERVGEEMMWQIERRIATLEALSERAAKTGQVTREFQRRIGEAAGAIHDEMFAAVRLPAPAAPGGLSRIGEEGLEAGLAGFKPEDPLIRQMLAERGTWMHEQAYQFLRRAGNLPEGTVFTETTVAELAEAVGAKIPFPRSTGPDLYVLNHQTRTIMIVDMTRVAGRTGHVAKGAADAQKLAAAVKAAGWTVAAPIEMPWVGMRTTDEFGKAVADLLRPFAVPK